ncbi:MAG TPA: hypothetical protein VGG33_02790 [Polyangia bacterium]
MNGTRRSQAGSSLISLVTLLLTSAPALAQIEPSPVPMENPTATPTVMGGSELTSIMQPGGSLVIAVPLVISLSKDFVADPINIPLDIYYGVSDDLTLGITHSNGVVQGVMPYQITRGLCLSGDVFCSKPGPAADRSHRFYNNIGLDALLRLAAGTLQLAGHGGLDFASLDPSAIHLRLGVLAKAPLGENIAILTDPRVLIALNKRDAGNDDYLTFPIAVQLGTASGLRLSGMTGISGPLDGFGDAFTGWLGAFLALGVNQSVDVFGSFTFETLYGKNGGADWRTLVIGANFRL